MPTSRVKTNLFLNFETAAKWENVGYTRRSHRLILKSANKISILPNYSIYFERNGESIILMEQ